MVSSATFYAVASGSAYLAFFVIGRDRFHPDFEPDPEENRRAMGLAAWACVGNSLLMTPFHWATANGYSAVTTDLAAHPWWYAPISVLIVLALTETGVYWAHRALHSRALFRWIHVQHHRFVRPTPWASFAMHPLDAFAQALPLLACSLFVPMQLWVHLAMLAFVSCWSVAIHDRVTFVRHPWLNTTANHTLHHRYNRYNYGQYTTFWDRLMGTWRDPAARVVRNG